MKRILVGITGASGSIYGIRLLEELKKAGGIETHLILTAAARTTLAIETDYTPEMVAGLADFCHNPADLAAPPASGSFKMEAMAIVPCSMKSLSAVANSYCADLLSRAADVTLKEGRKLILCPRETPLHKGHLQLLVKAADIGATIIPPIPAFYHRPKTIDDIVNHTVSRLLDALGVENSLSRRWGDNG
ncbi:UbiX family flavin prenyltransferase [bacterium]|nr:MAG: UbiX family flavin prenyltransferase [bacterium]